MRKTLPQGFRVLSLHIHSPITLFLPPRFSSNNTALLRNLHKIPEKMSIFSRKPNPRGTRQFKISLISYPRRINLSVIAWDLVRARKFTRFDFVLIFLLAKDSITVLVLFIKLVLVLIVIFSLWFQRLFERASEKCNTRPEVLFISNFINWGFFIFLVLGREELNLIFHHDYFNFDCCYYYWLLIVSIECPRRECYFSPFGQFEWN